MLPAIAKINPARHKPRVNICSALRQGSTYSGTFFHLIKALSVKGYELAAITIVVDGETLTDASLVAAENDPRVSFVFEGARAAPTCFMHERSISWARAGNLALEQSLKTPSDFTLWVESDLTFPCDLIELLIEPKEDIVAPVVMLGENFYDSWGFRNLAGRRIATLSELQALPRNSKQLIELSTVGSCLLLRTSLLTEGIRIPSGYENGLLVGFCLAARARGSRVFCRPDVAIVHPTSLWAEQIYKVTSCRISYEDNWREIAPSGGTTIAGPYFDFVIPEAKRILIRNARSAKRQNLVAYSCNARREIAILLGDNHSLPPSPEGFEAPSAPQPMPPVDVASIIKAFLRNLFRAKF